MSRILSERAKEWQTFSKEVLIHVDEYTVPQYGDKGEDQVTEWSPDECILTIKKYAARFGSNIREGQNEMDLKKIAHYACLAYFKLKDKINKERSE